MKKYLSIIFASLAAGLAAVSCVDEKTLVVYDPANVTAQTLGEIPGGILSEEGADITTTYNEADFNLSAPAGYTLYAAQSGTDFAEKTKVNATISGGTITMTQKDINNLVLNLGGEADTEFSLDFVLEGYLINDKNAVILNTTVSSNKVSSVFVPYAAERLDVDMFDHVWIIGASASVGAWAHDKVYQYLYNYNKDGNTYTGVIDFGEETAAGGWKITGTDGWVDDLNWGSADQAEGPEVPEIQLVSGGGSKDIKAYSKRFYQLNFNSSTLVLKMISGWNQMGIVGSFNGWDPANPDCVMTYNDSYHRFWIDYTFAEGDELKFNADGGWDLNWGENCELGAGNIAVPAGSYRVYLDFNNKTYTFSASMFGKEEPTLGGGGSDPVDPVTYQGWGIIGDFNDWSGDAAMTEKDGVWTGYVTLAADQGWKIRKDAGWDEDFGGVLVALGQPFEAVAGGDNISVPADGFYKVVYNSNDGTITVSEGNVWSLIGEFNDWAGDLDMIEADGIWTASEVELSGEWKIRHNHAWDEDRGGVFEEFGKAFEAIAGGANISAGDGKFNVVYDSVNETITVTNAAKSWGVIGDFNGWAGDAKMTEVAPGVWVSDFVELTGGWKVRFDGGWDVNLGGATPSAQGVFVEAVPGGDNITLEGTFKVVLNTNNGTIGTLGYGLVGSIGSLGFGWNEDLPMNLGKDGKWYSIPVALTTADEFKLRYNAGWDINVGGVYAEAEAAFAAEEGGANIKVEADGTYMVVYDPEAGQITLTKNFWGMIGDFNGWAADLFMMYDGAGNWVAYRAAVSGGWKIRQGSGWDVNRGGEFAASGEAFALTQDGPNISVADAETISAVYAVEAETMTVTVL